MPEGHTIHRIARDQFAALGHRPVAVTSPQGRFAAGAALVDGWTLAGVDAWGKHLFYRFDPPAGPTAPTAPAGGESEGGDLLVHVHLGLFGKFFPSGELAGRVRASPAADSPPSGSTTATRQVRLRLAGATAAFDLTGPTTCEVITPGEAKLVTDRLGPDPLRRDADPAQAWSRISRRRTPIGAALLDQSVVSGVGNVFRAEALYLHGMHPERPSHTLDRAEWDELWATLVRLLRAGVRTGAIATVARRDPTVHDGRTRYVYKQERCARCGTAVRRWQLAGRWAYACENCQPPWPA